jgi:murein L,D-transpeptidase YafK
MKKLATVIFTIIIAVLLVSCAASKADRVVVNKSQSKLYVMKKGKQVKAYNVAFGPNPVGHKQHEGDGRTPEGRYELDFKNINSKFYKSIRVSYPNAYDIARAEAMGLNPGGDIMIHGQTNGHNGVKKYNWTEGCIALSNKEMDEVWGLIDVGTPIEIIS